MVAAGAVEVDPRVVGMQGALLGDGGVAGRVAGVGVVGLASAASVASATSVASTAIAAATVVTGGTRFGMMMAREKARAAARTVSLSTSGPSRRWWCQSSGRRIRSSRLLLKGSGTRSHIVK